MHIKTKLNKCAENNESRNERKDKENKKTENSKRIYCIGIVSCSMVCFGACDLRLGITIR